MGKFKRMDQVRKIIESFLSTNSIKSMARRMQVSKNTVRGYVCRGKAHCEDLSKILLLGETDFLVSIIIFRLRILKIILMIYILV